MDDEVALVIGARGVIGGNLVEHLRGWATGEWSASPVVAGSPTRWSGT